MVGAFLKNLERDFLVERLTKMERKGIIMETNEMNLAFGRVGLTTILTDGDAIIIEHRGNMGSSIEQVHKNAKSYLGFDVRKNCSLISEEGSPDYYYCAKYILG